MNFKLRFSDRIPSVASRNCGRTPLTSHTAIATRIAVRGPGPSLGRALA